MPSIPKNNLETTGMNHEEFVKEILENMNEENHNVYHSNGATDLISTSTRIY